ncbi:MATE family efflux transporter [Sphingomonas edaphi]|uniref:Multidrug-efflux transporter n=1 Tax=Sphingomonas edaphi TaxID=2315689 RepID=A0A418Q2P5_9SPHN|nr:MATE family efflux transporter [Sphingomonas edaphi]RIX32073.1 MATE family efflux transporter [Sphingomonas edaphi]
MNRGGRTISRQSWREELHATMALAWPLMLANLTMQLIQATDVVLLGWLGPKELAAAALALSLSFGMILFALGVLTASSPMMASALGERSNAVRDVRRTFRQSLWAAVIMTIPTMIVLWNAEPVILALGQEPELARLAGIFLRGYMWVIPSWMLFQVMRNFLSAMERPGWVLVISATGIPLNALVCWSLIFGHLGMPRLGIIGAGLGSSIVWAAMALALAAVILSDRQFRRFQLFGRFWRSDWPRFRAMFRLGGPIGLTMGFEGGVFSAAAYLMGLFGASSVAAHQIALQIAATTFMVPLALGQATTVRVGLAYGRRDRDGVALAGWTAFGLSIAFMAVMATIMYAFPRELITLFLADTAENASVIALGVSFLMIAALFQIVDGAQVVGAGMLRGLHDTRVPMVYALFGYWAIGLGVGVALAFALDWRGIGIWMGLAAGLGMVAVLMLWRWSRRDRLGLLLVSS